MIVLFSGGLDSTVCLAWALKERSGKGVAALFVRYSQAALEAEQQAARVICRRLGVQLHETDVALHGGITGECDTADPTACVVPIRNLVLLALAAAFAASRKHQDVVIGCNGDDAESFPDCRRRTLDYIETAIRQAGLSITIQSPLVGLTKRGVIELGASLGATGAILRSSSCYLGTECGACYACQARARGMSEAGVRC